MLGDAIIWAVIIIVGKILATPERMQKAMEQEAAEWLREQEER